jgi:hypothetical protein
MLGRDFNRIMRTCCPALEKNGAHETLGYIEVRCKDGVGVASACDGFFMAQCRFAYKGDDGIFLLRSHKTVRNDTWVSILVSASGKKISIADDSEIVTRNAVVGDYVDLGKVVAIHEKKKARATITISASRLRRILESFSKNDDAVMFEIRGETDAVIMRGEETYALLLPIRDERRELAAFARPVIETTKEDGKK